MNNIIEFRDRLKDKRKQFEFRVRKLKVHIDGEINFPCIVLYERETGIPVGYPGFERWYLSLIDADYFAESTIRKKAINICEFLNFILWHTKCDKISDVSIDDIRNFLIFYRETMDGDRRDPEEWNRGIGQVYHFLITYYEHNQYLPIKYRPEDLYSVEVITNGNTNRKSVVRKYNKFGIKAYNKTTRKNRYLVHGYLDFILYECKKYDPMILLGIALQAYAGLRAGEVVNLTRASVQLQYAGFGRIGKIKIDLRDEAPFAQNWDGDSEFGHIKIYREQEVFPDFIPKVKEMLNEHEAMLPDVVDVSMEPLFTNKWGKPMSVSTYRGRVKDIFMNHFLPHLKMVCNREGTWAENVAYIEAYEKEYPGAHMFRHWFTMYLLERTDITHDEISKWRGDSSPESMADYVHVNADMIALYKKSGFAFQRALLEEVL